MSLIVKYAGSVHIDFVSIAVPQQNVIGWQTMPLNRPKGKPIVLSTPMVQALMNTKPGVWPADPIDPEKPYKWQTLRVVKPQPDKNDPCITYDLAGWLEVSPGQEDEIWAQTEEGQNVKLNLKYRRGDILWVRETFAVDRDGNYIYKSDPMFDCCTRGDIAWDWKPPIFMPRVAARLFLEVKAVRIERLRDITEEDAKAEGILPTAAKFGGCKCRDRPDRHGKFGCPKGCNCFNARENFFGFWDSLNAKRTGAEKKPDYSWKSNPWVWVHEFGRVEK